MDFLPTPLHDQDQHAIDSMVDEGQIGSDVGYVATLYAPREDVARVLAGSRRSPTPERLDSLCLPILRSLPDAEQFSLALSAVSHLRLCVADTMCYIGTSMFVDLVTGGNAFAWLPEYRIRKGVVYRRIARRLESRRAMRAYVYSSGWADRLRDIALRMKSDGTQDRLLSLHDLPRFPVDERRLEAFRFWGAAHDTTPDSPSHMPRLLDAALITRSMKAASSVVGSAAVSDLVAGLDVVIPGDQADWIFSRQGRLDRLGHGALSVTVAHKGGVKAASLCVYVKNTPPLDQLAAYAMLISAGCEADIINKANLVNVHPGGYSHALVAKRQKEDETGADMIRGLVARSRSSIHNKVMRLSQEYFERRASTWVDVVQDYVYGRNCLIRRAADGLHGSASRIHHGNTAVVNVTPDQCEVYEDKAA